MDGFQRLESGSTSRGGTLSASRVDLSGQLTHSQGDGGLVEDAEDDYGWLYAKEVNQSP